MLILYDPLEDYWNEVNRQKSTVELKFYASEVNEFLGLSKKEELSGIINRAMKVCLALHISIEENFRTIFRFTENGLITDWKLSALACYLLAVNADPSNPIVAKAQIFFTLKNTHNVNI